jgi:perosamine synthetase
MTKLAMFGGTRTIGPGGTDRATIGWPVVTDAERAAVLRVLASGKFTSNSMGDGEVQLLEREWAQFVGVPHCAAVSNGTAAIALAMEALGLRPGDEFLVPALTFIGSAIGPVQRSLVPVFVDIDPVSFTIDPKAAEAAITPRTKAILAVHLHGLPCDMVELRALCDRHGLRLVEDAAQAHGARYQGRRVGAWGDLAAFSLNVTKNFPTCGEGGLVTTSDAELHEQVILRRQFGEDLRPDRDRDYLSRIVAGNEKLSAIQAAFARCQLERLDDYAKERDGNVRALLGRLSALPGLVVPTCPPDREHAWHILRFRFDPGAALGEQLPPGAFRAAIHRAMKAEGVPLLPYQLVPLPAQPAFRSDHGATMVYRAEYYPQTLAVIDDSLTLQRWHLNPASGPVLSKVADAFEKLWENLEPIGEMARARAAA